MKICVPYFIDILNIMSNTDEELELSESNEAESSDIDDFISDSDDAESDEESDDSDDDSESEPELLLPTIISNILPIKTGTPRRQRLTLAANVQPTKIEELPTVNVNKSEAIPSGNVKTEIELNKGTPTMVQIKIKPANGSLWRIIDDIKEQPIQTRSPFEAQILGELTDEYTSKIQLLTIEDKQISKATAAILASMLAQKVAFGVQFNSDIERVLDYIVNA